MSLTESWPAGLTYVGATPSQGSYDDSTGLWTIGSIASGDSVTLTLTGTVDADQGGATITNSVTAASGDQSDPGTTGDDLTESIFAPIIAVDDKSFGNEQGQPAVINVLANDDYSGVVNPSVLLVDTSDALVARLNVPGEGIWTVEAGNFVRFTPNADFVADPRAISYVIAAGTGSNKNTETRPSIADGRSGAHPRATANISNKATIFVDYLGVETSDDLVAADDELVGQDRDSPVTVTPLRNDANGNTGELVVATLRLLDENNNTVTELVVPGEGTWSVNAQNGTVTFVPEPGFTGSSTTVRYYVENADGTPQTATITILFIDPRGVVYDTDTLRPLKGVKLQFVDAAGVALPASCFPRGQQPQTTERDGRYRFDLSIGCTNAAGREFRIEIVDTRGYSVQPTPEGYDPGVLDPGTPSTGIYEVASYDNAPTSAQTRRYFTRFLIGTNSRQIVNNHIPLKRLATEVEEDLLQVLEDDLAATMTQQSLTISGFAKDALARLKKNSHKACAAEVDRVFKKHPIAFASGSAQLPEDAGPTLDRVARIMEHCEEIAFEVHGYVDPGSGALDGHDLSLSRAQSIAQALRRRGIDSARLLSRPYQLRYADVTNAGRINVKSNGRLITDASCADSVALDRSLNAEISSDGGYIDGNFTRERRDCARDGWTIFSGSLSYLRNDQGMDQGMLQLSYRRERFVTDDHLAGWFVGGYASSNDISGRADGTINGFGLNAGVYGARQLENALFIDYYLGAAVGRHRFDLTFDRASGPISAKGYYDYSAIFAGMAVSGQTYWGDYAVTPRFGLDAAWSPGGTAEVEYSQGMIGDDAGLRLSSVSGLKLFAELQFDDLLPNRPESLMVAPRVFCEKPIGQSQVDCGYGFDLRLSHEAEDSKSRYEVAFTTEKTKNRDSYSLSASFVHEVGDGVVEGAAEVTQNNAVAVSLNYGLDF